MSSRGGGRAGGRSTASSSSSSITSDFDQKLDLNPPVEQQQQQPVPVSSKNIRFPARPGYGSIGRKCVVRANHFLVQVSSNIDIHHYDVAITPEVTVKKVCRKIMKELVHMYKASEFENTQLAYDGKKNVYTAGALPFTSKEFVVKLGDKRKEREFKVTIRFAAKADIHHLQQFLQRRQLDAPQETIQALDVVLRATPSENYEIVGRSFFSPSFGKGELADGLQYWKGYYQSLRPTQMGLSLNIDMSARAFYEPILVSEFVAKYFNRDLGRPLSDQDRIKVKRTLKGVRIELNHMKSVKYQKITGLSTQPSSQLMFPLDESGTTISVAQYFREKYRISLRYPSLPAVNAGTDAKPIYLPMEVCKIVEGQRYSKKLNEKQVTALLRATCQRPSQREDIIMQIARNNNYNTDKIAKFEFGMQVRVALTSIDARVLPPPTIKYHETGRESRVDPRVGQWNMINKKMTKGGTVDSWSFVNFSRARTDMVNQFCHELISMCGSKGMVFNPRPLAPNHSANPRNIENVLISIHTQSTAELARMGLPGQQKQLQLLIIILPDVSGSYGMIKRVCETELGIVSQCCQPKHVSRISKQYLENLALKINVKVGGQNSVLLDMDENRIPFLTDRPTIIFGTDVTHPQPGEESSSIAAVVASMDWPQVTKYRGLVSAQRSREEIIQDLHQQYEDPQKKILYKGMIRDHLLAFYKSTAMKPDRIIFYRDGVSEGQFHQVLLHEVDAIRRACYSIQEDYQPRITFVVVQKRHHTRFFPANHKDQNMTDRSGNILPGTVIDTNICHPTEFDFYLCSHAGIQGTSRPAHYHVLYDENRFTPDAMQMLTNNLCYTYARCTRSVSIVPPAYYAHLAAFRARYYTEGDLLDADLTSSGGGGGKATREGDAVVPRLPDIKENVKAVMFFC